MNAPARTASPSFPSEVIASSTGRNLPGLEAVERGHREAEVLELLPVELGRLLQTGPDDRPARRVDSVGEVHPLVEADTGQNGREGERNPVEGVVVVVQDDHP